jgi:hypothetical protein
MNRILSRLFPVVALALLVTACKDDPKRTITEPTEVEQPAPELGTIAYLTISDSTPAKGSTITVTARATSSDVAAFGSFAGHVTFDSLGLAYVGDVSASAGMRAVNPKAGDLAIAGVNLTGFEDGELFAITLRVVNPVSIGSLALSMSELTSTNYVNQRAKLSVQRAVRLGRAVPIVE